MGLLVVFRERFRGCIGGRHVMCARLLIAHDRKYIVNVVFPLLDNVTYRAKQVSLSWCERFLMLVKSRCKGQNIHLMNDSAYGLALRCRQMANYASPRTWVFSQTIVYPQPGFKRCRSCVMVWWLRRWAEAR